MSECIYEIINFPKYHRKNLIYFCPGRFHRLGTFDLFWLFSSECITYLVRIHFQGRNLSIILKKGWFHKYIHSDCIWPLGSLEHLLIFTAATSSTIFLVSIHKLCRLCALVGQYQGTTGCLKNVKSSELCLCNGKWITTKLSISHICHDKSLFIIIIYWIKRISAEWLHTYFQRFFFDFF